MKSKISVIAGLLMVAFTSAAAPFNIYSTFFSAPGIGPCGLDRNAYAPYAKTAAQGWGWKFDLNTTIHTASVANSEYVVEYVGNHGHRNCNFGTVIVSGDSTEKFRFTVYHPTANGQWPTNSYAVTLTGFLP